MQDAVATTGLRVIVLVVVIGSHIRVEQHFKVSNLSLVYVVFIYLF